MAGQKRKLAGEGRGRRYSVPLPAPLPARWRRQVEPCSVASIGVGVGRLHQIAPATLVKFGPSSVGPSTAPLFEDFYERLPFLGRRRLKLLYLGRRLQATLNANARKSAKLDDCRAEESTVGPRSRRSARPDDVQTQTPRRRPVLPACRAVFFGQPLCIRF